MPRKTVRIGCVHDECPNFFVCAPNDYIPNDWICPSCLDAEHQQQVEALSRTQETTDADVCIRR